MPHTEAVQEPLTPGSLCDMIGATLCGAADLVGDVYYRIEDISTPTPGNVLTRYYTLPPEPLREMDRLTEWSRNIGTLLTARIAHPSLRKVKDFTPLPDARIAPASFAAREKIADSTVTISYTYEQGVAPMRRLPANTTVGPVSVYQDTKILLLPSLPALASFMEGMNSSFAQEPRGYQPDDLSPAALGLEKFDPLPLR